jgi:hypothetical protein
MAAEAPIPETSFLLRLEKCDVFVSEGDTRIFELATVAINPPQGWRAGLFFAWPGGQAAMEWIGPPHRCPRARHSRNLHS